MWITLLLDLCYSALHNPCIVKYSDIKHDNSIDKSGIMWASVV